jgi:hypothetical protein
MKIFWESQIQTVASSDVLYQYFEMSKIWQVGIFIWEQRDIIIENYRKEKPQIVIQLTSLVEPDNWRF